MKFEVKQDIFETGIKNINLSDKEADYIVALASGVEKDQILKCLQLTNEDIEKLYLKFGLKNKKRIRDIQLVTTVSMGNFISEYFEYNTGRQFEFKECHELEKTIKEIEKNDKKFKADIEQVVEEAIAEHFGK